MLTRAANEGATLRGFVWGALGAVWLVALLLALIRDRQARGWVVFALIGWVSYLWPLLRRLVRGTATAERPGNGDPGA